jgi:hypothetical protein
MAAELEAIPRCYGWGELPLTQGHLPFQCYCIVCQGRMIWETRCGVVDMILLFLEFHFTPGTSDRFSRSQVLVFCSRFFVCARAAPYVFPICYLSFFPLFPPLSEKRNTQSGANFTFTIVNRNLGVPPYNPSHDKFYLFLTCKRN